MRPAIKMLLLLALIIIGAALFFVILDDEDTGASPLAGVTCATGTPGSPGSGTGAR